MSKKVVYAFGIIALFVVFMNFYFAPNNILSWDVFGYYLYLPLAFIYQDLGMLNDDVILGIIDQYGSTSTLYQALQMNDGTWVMKYSMGMSILYAPFFFIGWFFAKVLNYPIDGFSAPFQYAIFLGGITYSLIGIWFTAKVLSRFFSTKITITTLVLIVFATNYIVHITMHGQNAMSQNYLFTGYALVLWLTIRWHETLKLKYMFFLGLVSGLMILSRPTEIVVLIIPMLWNVSSKETLIEKIELLWKNRIQIAFFVLIVGGLGSVQLIYWKLYTGKFLFNSYGGNPSEGLELLSPYTKQFLFSFRKGWLIYTPIMAFAIAGFYQIYKNNRPIFWALFGYFVFNLYLVSSWSTWWYAQSFSQRAMVSSYPIMAIGLGYFLTWVKKQQITIKWIGVAILTFLTVLNVFQTYQWHQGVIHGDRMTKEYYLAVFGKISATDEDKKLLMVERSFDEVELFSNEKEYSHKVFEVLNFDGGLSGYDSIKHSGCCAYVLNPDSIYSPFIGGSYQELTTKDHTWMRISVWVYPMQSDVTNLFSLSASFDYNGYPYKYKTLDSEDLDLKLFEWNKIEFDYLTPEVRSISDKFRVIVWNRGESTFLVDDLKVEVFEKK